MIHCTQLKRFLSAHRMKNLCLILFDIPRCSRPNRLEFLSEVEFYSPFLQMEAIDFKKLLREERKRAKNRKSKPNLHESESKTSINKNEDSEVNERRVVAGFVWQHPDDFLDFRELTLKTICENPRTISYSPRALGKQLSKAPNENETSVHESNAGVSDATTNTVTPIPPEDALIQWLKNLPSGDSGLGEWKVMSYGKRRVCMFGEETGGKLPPPLAEIARELVKRNIFPSSSCPPPNHVLLNEYQAGQGILPHTDGPLYEHRTATLSLGTDVVIEFTKRLASSEIRSSENRTTSAPMSTREKGCETEGVRGNSGTENNDTHNEEQSSILSTDIQSSTTTPIQVLLESGSLLVFQGDAYLNYCHGIGMDVCKDVTTDRCLNAPSGQSIPRGLRYSLTFRHKKTETKQTEQIKRR